MAVLLEEREGLERHLTVDIARELIDQKVNSRLIELQHSARAPGFRPGKMPLPLIKKRFHDPVRSEILEQLINDSFQQACEERNLKLASTPIIDGNFDEVLADAEFKYSATFEVLPEITLTDFANISLRKPAVSIHDQDIAEVIEKMREQKATYSKVERQAQRNDQVLIDFLGSLNGEPFKGGKGEDFRLVLGSGQTIPGFEDQIISHAAPEEFDIEVQFPEAYHEKNLAGKMAIFHIHLKEVAEQQLPEINEEFYKSFDVEGGADAFREQVLGTMETVVKKFTHDKLKEQVFKQLLDLHDFPLPNSMIQTEIEHAMHSDKHQHEHKHDHDHEHSHEHEHTTAHSHTHDVPNQVKDDARRRVKFTLLLQKLIETLNITVKQDDIEAKVDEMILQYAYPDFMKQYIMKNEKMMNNLSHEVIEDHIIDRILSSATIVDESLSYHDLLTQKD